MNGAKLPTNGFRRGPPSSRGVDELPAEPNACALHPNFCRLNPLNKWLRPLALVNPLEFAPVDPSAGRAKSGAHASNGRSSTHCGRSSPEPWTPQLGGEADLGAPAKARSPPFAHVDGVETPKLSLCRPKLPQRHVRDGQQRQQIVSKRAWRRHGFGYSIESVATAAALPFQLIGEGRPR